MAQARSDVGDAMGTLSSRSYAMIAMGKEIWEATTTASLSYARLVEATEAWRESVMNVEVRDSLCVEIAMELGRSKRKSRKAQIGYQQLAGVQYSSSASCLVFSRIFGS